MKILYLQWLEYKLTIIDKIKIWLWFNCFHKIEFTINHKISTLIINNLFFKDHSLIEK